MKDTYQNILVGVAAGVGVIDNLWGWELLRSGILFIEIYTSNTIVNVVEGDFFQNIML